jgi:hypothetical protein
MGTLIGSIFPNDFARRYNGTSQYDWLANPANMGDTVGAVSFWFYIPALLTADGFSAIYTIADSGVKVGSQGRYINIGIRRNASGYGNTNNYLDVVFIGSGTTIYVKSNSTPISAAGWYHAVFTSNAEIYVNAATPSYTPKWTGGGGFDWITGQWFGSVGGTNKDLSIGARRLTGVATNYASVDVNEVIYLNAVPTSTEVGLLYGGGTAPDPGLLPSTLQSKLSIYRDFENTLVPVIGSGTLTAVGSPTYIAFP